LTKKVSRRLEAGRDRLLEQHSFNARTAADIVRQIRESDLDVTLEQFMIDLFRFHGVFSEPLGKRTYKLWSESPLDESFPALRTSRPLVTFDRAYALVREDIEFMTADHPAVSSGLDMFLGAEKGNCCLAHCRSRRSPAQRGLFLEAHFVLECIAPPDLYVDRFLSPTPLRVMVDTALKDRSDLFADKDFEHSLSETTEMPVLEDDDLQSTLLPAMQVAAAKCAQGAAIKIIGIARSEMLRVVGAEADRSAALSKVNPTVRQEDIAALRSEIQRLDTAISGATPRLDSIRLIVLG
jgi:ATP-dependent helicase HepA